MSPSSSLDTRDRILDAALDLFSEHGFDGTTLQQIADRVGLTKAALYHHFRSKDDLLEALVMPAIVELDGLLDGYEASLGTRAGNRGFVRDYLEHLLRHRRLVAYIFRDVATIAHPVISSGNRERLARVESALVGTELDFNEQVRVAMALGGMQAVIARYPEASDDDLRAALLDATRSLLRFASRRGMPGRQREHPRNRRAT
jgi:AcrR family transcriptional regulator